MTSIHIYDPSGGTSLPELPPLPIGALVVGAQNLLQEAADLPQPIYVTVHEATQRIGVMFDANPASARAITLWALRFGGVVTNRTDPDGGHWPVNCGTKFDYFGVHVDAYAYLPAKQAAT